MAGVKISNLTELTGTPPDTAVLPIVSGGITQKVAIANIKTPYSRRFWGQGWCG